MTDSEARGQVVQYWLQQAKDALDSARAETGARRFHFAVNRAYYACFYAAAAVLLQEGRKFVKHSGVRAALHRFLVRTGQVSQELGKSYDLLAQRRGQADYAEFVAFDEPQVSELTQKAEEFVTAMERLVAPA